MSACRDCRYWQPFLLGGAETGDGSGYEISGLWSWDSEGEQLVQIDRDVDWGICTRQQFPGRPMFTVDASDYYSTLSTRAEFSCSAFEERT